MRKILGVAFVVVGVVGFLVANYIHYHNKGVTHEAGIEAQYKQNQNSLSAYSLTVAEQMGVAKENQKALADLIKASLEGRYGETGSKAFIQAFTEAYPGTLDSAIFTNIQNAIEAGRRDFANEQKLLIGRVQAYERDLKLFWSGMWLGMAGYPSIDLAQYRVIVSEHTQETYRTGVDTGIKFD